MRRCLEFVWFGAISTINQSSYLIHSGRTGTSTIRLDFPFFFLSLLQDTLEYATMSVILIRNINFYKQFAFKVLNIFDLFFHFSTTSNISFLSIKVFRDWEKISYKKDKINQVSRAPFEGELRNFVGAVFLRRELLIKQSEFEKIRLSPTWGCIVQSSL